MRTSLDFRNRLADELRQLLEGTSLASYPPCGQATEFFVRNLLEDLCWLDDRKAEMFNAMQRVTGDLSVYDFLCTSSCPRPSTTMVISVYAEIAMRLGFIRSCSRYSLSLTAETLHKIREDGTISVEKVVDRLGEPTWIVKQGQLWCTLCYSLPPDNGWTCFDFELEPNSSTRLELKRIRGTAEDGSRIRQNTE